ncbi:MAG TPA: S1/P1 nuclease [Verrucomicrobiae bacterium]|nr:S1/P1 nuclease [Verrucomicrobiae bacterium]
MRKFLAATLAALVLPVPGFPWGGEGHDLVARIAQAQLTAKVRAKIDAILGPGVTIVSISSWADQVRRDRPESGPWHYVDIPIDQPHLDMARDCPKGDCVIAAIAKFRAQLRDRATPADKRKEALEFVVHFVGDMHQPLHCSDDKDQGGNAVRTMVAGADRTSNLHSVWDSTILGHMGKEDDLYPTMLKEALKNRKKWSKGTVEQWAEESHQAAVDVAYGKLPVKPVAGVRNETPITIDASYEDAARPLIRMQIEKAGDRLARVLNESLK